MPTATPAPTATPVPTATPAPTATPVPTATPAPTATPTPTPITQQVVSTQAELNAALASSNPDLKEVVIEQSGASSFEIPKEDKSDLTLVVNAPNGEVVNNGNFKEIVIKAIASNTFIEKATGNNIIFQAATGRVAIDEGASANIEVNKGESEAPKLDLVNNGTVSELTLSTKADVNVSGKNTAAAIPVTSTASAGGSTISTSQNLNLKAESKVELTLNAGAENTTATVSDAANIPDVKGLGKVPVKDSDSGKLLDTVVAEKDETVKANKVSVSGKVVTSEDKAPFAGASVYLLNYAAGINKGNVSQYLTEENKVADTTEDGTYAFEAEWGNYWFVVKAEGYRTVLQTVEITSAYENAFSNEQVELVAGEDDATGNIELTLVDAATGDAIDYAVALEIREGANNVSGNILKEIAVEASANGKCAIEELPIGSYTIQVVSADAKSEIVAAPFSVTVIAGQTITKPFSVTKIINDDQIRFVLRWGDEESGAPSDLDSHLVGPKVKGIGNFHTYYSDKTYEEYDGEDSYVKYADLDVDDTTWEGPETTTIYKQNAGTYCFYIYDFSDQEDEESKNMSDKSGAIVTVYRGSTLLNTFNVPTGQSGNLWHVCDYDSVTGRVTSVNTVGYWPNDGSSTVGMSEAEVLRDSLSRKISDIQAYDFVLADNAYKANMKTVLAEAENLADNSENMDDIRAMLQKLEEIKNDIQSVGTIENVKLDGEYVDWDTIEDEDHYIVNGIRIMGVNNTPGEIEVAFANASDDPLEVRSEDVSGQDYIKVITVTNTVSGISRIWKLYYEIDLSSIFRLTEDDIVGELITDVSVNCDAKYGYIYLSGVADSMPEFTVTVSEGITYSINWNAEDYAAIITMNKDGDSYEYRVFYNKDTDITSPMNGNISGKGIIYSYVNTDEKVITITGTEEVLKDVVMREYTDRTTEVVKNEQGIVESVVVTNTKYNVSDTYSVEYVKVEAPALENGTEYEVTLDDGQVQYYAFTPETTGYYTIGDPDRTELDIIINLYEEGALRANTWSNYLGGIYMEAGRTYYINVRQDMSDLPYTFSFKVVLEEEDNDNTDALSEQESEGFADETTAADTEAATFGDESFVEESETAPEADGFTAEAGFEESTEETAEVDADALAFEDFQ